MGPTSNKKSKQYELIIHEPPTLPDLIKLSQLPKIECTESIINFELKYDAFDKNRTKENRDAALEASKFLYDKNDVLTPDCISYFKRETDGIENFIAKMETLRHHKSRSKSGQGGGSGVTDLSSILPKNSFYPFNSNILANSVDSRAAVPQPHVQRGGKRNRNHHRRNNSTRSHSKRGSKRGSKRSYVNYAGRQIGCRSRSQRRNQRQSRRQRQARTQLRRRAQLQSGGDAFSYLPQDANMAARSATTFVGNLWADLQGKHNTVSPLPFSDQAIQSTSSSSGSDKP